MKSQPGGIWRETGGGSMAPSNTTPTQSSADRGLVAPATPGLVANGPAIGGSPRGARSGGNLTSRSLAGAHPTSGARFGATSGFRSRGNKAVGGKRPSLGAHRQPGTKSHSGPTPGSGSSKSHAKAQSHSAFTPSGSSTMGGMRQPGSAGETIP
jgi:hypothetical protein